jgi:protein O-GlcNAc transferase
MKKVISFSIWGNNPTYNIGAIRNAELSKVFYPDFECWFYIHEETVPQETIQKLSRLDNSKIILKNGDLSICKPMMWRFEAIDESDVEIMMSRDTDTRILLREKLAVDEWLKSDKLFHIMRDHPHHEFKILGGMFGTKKIKNIPNWKNIMYNYKQNGDRNYDQNFLHEYIYKNVINISLIHASFHKFEGSICNNFPIPYDNEFKFVGEYVYADESRSQTHIDALKNSL